MRGKGVRGKGGSWGVMEGRELGSDGGRGTGRSSCRLSGVVVSTGAGRSWVGSLSSTGGGSSMGGHHYLGSGIVIRGWGIVVCGWGITFRGWGLSLSVDGGARRLLWFERHGRRSRGWWAFMRVVGVVLGFVWVVGVRVGVGIHIGVVGGQSSLSVDRASLCMGLSASSLCFVGRGSWCC